jgi:Arc/MetJ-type ribon-helix-helix transcriptional regulator
MKTFIEISKVLLEGVDEMVEEGYFNDRTEGVNQAVEEMLSRYKIGKLRMKDKRVKQGEKDSKLEM